MEVEGQLGIGNKGVQKWKCCFSAYQVSHNCALLMHCAFLMHCCHSDEWVINMRLIILNIKDHIPIINITAVYCVVVLKYG